MCGFERLVRLSRRGSSGSTNCLILKHIIVRIRQSKTHNNGFRRWRIAPQGNAIDRYKHVGFGKIRRDAATGNLARYYDEARGRAQFLFAIVSEMTGDVELIARFPSTFPHIIGMDQNYPAALKDSAVTIIESIDRSVVLVMGTKSRHQELRRFQGNRLLC